MRRIPDVFDVWFDSGSMPYAQVHYPFENVDWFESHFPGDFIVEYIGQTRGWFYTAARPGHGAVRPARRSTPCVAHGIVLGNDGQKMSKSLRNYPDVSRGVRPRRLRRDALVPDGVTDPARRQPDRHRTGHPRGCAPGAAAAVERLQLSGAVRAESRYLADEFTPPRWTATFWPSSLQLRDDLTDVVGRLRHLGGVR